MGVGLILTLLNELKKKILCDPLATIILFYLTSLMNLALNMHEYSIDHIPHKRTIYRKKPDHFSPTRL